VPILEAAVKREKVT
jgi:cullin 1